MGEETEKPPAGRVSIFVIAKTFLAKKRASRAVLEHRKSADDVAPLRHEQLGIDAASFRTQGNADHYSRSALERRAARLLLLAVLRPESTWCVLFGC